MKTQQTHGHAKPTKKKSHSPAPVAPPKAPEVHVGPTHERTSGPAERAENEGMRAPPTTTKIEGEGSYAATHRYDDGVAHSVAKGDTARLAKEAARALDGPEGTALRQAEADAKKGHSSREE